MVALFSINMTSHEFRNTPLILCAGNYSIPLCEELPELLE
jgi:hypothetical protein